MTELNQILMPIFVGVSIGLSFFLIMMLITNWRGVQTYFDMVPRREIMTETTWGKYNVLANKFESGFSVWKSYDGSMTYSMSVSYKNGDVEISNRFRENDINLVVEKGYAWAESQGLLKE
jgi:hypothetical protein